MNTITTTASSTILAIDLGKYKSVVCGLDDATGEYRFTTFDTSRGELRKLLSKEQPSVVLIEACLLAGWVLDLCDDAGVRCRMGGSLPPPGPRLASLGCRVGRLRSECARDEMTLLEEGLLISKKR